jgi:hypothetical protein
VKNSVTRLLGIMSAVCFSGVTGCSSFDARPQHKLTADYVEIGPQTYNTESHDFERPGLLAPNRINSSRKVDREVISKSGLPAELLPASIARLEPSS